MTSQFHEDLNRDGDNEPRASERSFGLVFTAVFVLVGLTPLLKGHDVRWWALIVALAFGILAFAAPRLLAPLNRIWMAFGKLLHRIVSPVVLGLLYCVAVVPTGLILRIKGSDPLRLKRDPAAKSYWLPRTPPGPATGSFKNQF